MTVAQMFTDKVIFYGFIHTKFSLILQLIYP